ncbi:hypothetical protein F2P79_003622 [Pimephales promelas]|nr:hypothetical protein F2P79_003622 [Pimephales promelas]
MLGLWSTQGFLFAMDKGWTQFTFRLPLFVIFLLFLRTTHGFKGGARSDAHHWWGQPSYKTFSPRAVQSSVSEVPVTGILPEEVGSSRFTNRPLKRLNLHQFVKGGVSSSHGSISSVLASLPLPLNERYIGHLTSLQGSSGSAATDTTSVSTQGESSFPAMLGTSGLSTSDQRSPSLYMSSSLETFGAKSAEATLPMFSQESMSSSSSSSPGATYTSQGSPVLASEGSGQSISPQGESSSSGLSQGALSEYNQDSNNMLSSSVSSQSTSDQSTPSLSTSSIQGSSGSLLEASGSSFQGEVAGVSLLVDLSPQSQDHSSQLLPSPLEVSSQSTNGQSTPSLFMLGSESSSDSQSTDPASPQDTEDSLSQSISSQSTSVQSSPSVSTSTQSRSATKLTSSNFFPVQGGSSSTSLYLKPQGALYAPASHTKYVSFPMSSHPAFYSQSKSSSGPWFGGSTGFATEGMSSAYSGSFQPQGTTSQFASGSPSYYPSASLSSPQGASSLSAAVQSSQKQFASTNGTQSGSSKLLTLQGSTTYGESLQPQSTTSRFASGSPSYYPSASFSSPQGASSLSAAVQSSRKQFTSTFTGNSGTQEGPSDPFKWQGSTTYGGSLQPQGASSQSAAVQSSQKQFASTNGTQSGSSKLLTLQGSTTNSESLQPQGTTSQFASGSPSYQPSLSPSPQGASSQSAAVQSSQKPFTSTFTGNSGTQEGPSGPFKWQGSTTYGGSLQPQGASSQSAAVQSSQKQFASTYGTLSGSSKLLTLQGSTTYGESLQPQSASSQSAAVQNSQKQFISTFKGNSGTQEGPSGPFKWQGSTTYGGSLQPQGASSLSAAVQSSQKQFTSTFTGNSGTQEGPSGPIKWQGSTTYGGSLQPQGTTSQFASGSLSYYPSASLSSTQGASSQSAAVHSSKKQFTSTFTGNSGTQEGPSGPFKWQGSTTYGGSVQPQGASSQSAAVQSARKQFTSTCLQSVCCSPEFTEAVPQVSLPLGLHPTIQVHHSPPPKIPKVSLPLGLHPPIQLKHHPHPKGFLFAMDKGWTQLPLFVIFLLFLRNTHGFKGGARSDAHHWWGQPSYKTFSPRAVQSSVSEVPVTGILPEEVGSSRFTNRPLKRLNLHQFVKGGVSSSHGSMSHAQTAPSSSVLASLPLPLNERYIGHLTSLQGSSGSAATDTTSVSTQGESSFPAMLGTSGLSTSDQSSPSLYMSSSLETFGAKSAEATLPMFSQESMSSSSSSSPGATYTSQGSPVLASEGSGQSISPQGESSSSGLSQGALSEYNQDSNNMLSSSVSSQSTSDQSTPSLSTSSIQGSSGSLLEASGSSFQGEVAGVSSLVDLSPQSQDNSIQLLPSPLEVSSQSTNGQSTPSLFMLGSESSSDSQSTDPASPQDTEDSLSQSISSQSTSVQSSPSVFTSTQSRSATKLTSSNFFPVQGGSSSTSLYLKPQGTLYAPASHTKYVSFPMSSHPAFYSQSKSSSGPWFGGSTGFATEGMSSAYSGSVQPQGTTSQFASGSPSYYPSVSPCSQSAAVQSSQKQFASSYGTQSGSSKLLTLQGSTTYGESLQPQGTTSPFASGSPSYYPSASPSSPQGASSQSAAVQSSQKQFASTYGTQSGSSKLLTLQGSTTYGESLQPQSTTSRFASGSLSYYPSASLSSPQGASSLSAAVQSSRKQFTSTFTGHSGTQEGPSDPFKWQGSTTYGGSLQPQGTASQFASGSPSYYPSVSPSSPQGAASLSAAVQSSQKQFASSYGTQSGSSKLLTLQGSTTNSESLQPQGTTSQFASGSPSYHPSVSPSSPQGASSQSAAVQSSQKQFTSTFTGNSGTQEGPSGPIKWQGSTTYGGSLQPQGTTSQFASGSLSYYPSASLSSPQVQSSQKQFASSYGTQSGSSKLLTLPGSTTYGGSLQPQDTTSQFTSGSPSYHPSVSPSSPQGASSQSAAVQSSKKQYHNASLSSPQGASSQSAAVQSSRKQFASSYGTQSGSSNLLTLQGSTTYGASLQPQGASSLSAAVQNSQKQFTSTFTGNSGTQERPSVPFKWQGSTTYGGSLQPQDPKSQFASGSSSSYPIETPSSPQGSDRQSAAVQSSWKQFVSSYGTQSGSSKLLTLPGSTTYGGSLQPQDTTSQFTSGSPSYHPSVSPSSPQVHHSPPPKVPPVCLLQSRVHRSSLPLPSQATLAHRKGPLFRSNGREAPPMVDHSSLKIPKVSLPLGLHPPIQLKHHPHPKVPTGSLLQSRVHGSSLSLAMAPSQAPLSH